jgi:ferric-dicitrate binding protein FerR (iron transport regulator)
MSRAEFYRAEVNRCRMAAVTSRDPEEARRWRDLAQGHQEVAESFERMNQLARGTPSVRRETPAAAPSQRPG